MIVKIKIKNLAEERRVQIRSQVRKFCETLTKQHAYDNGIEFDFDFDFERELKDDED